ncbi:MAG: LemA family protein [Sphingobacteriales bacterium]|nr:LemA family protein [Sphingobacteriales bacterium]
MPVLFGILAIITLVLVLLYNNLVRKKNAVENAFFSMDVMLKKRYDLIPQLVETVQGYMHHERELLTGLTELRQKILVDQLPTNEKVKLDNEINTILQQVRVQFENYPGLKASENFLRLQGAINETEEQLAASRRYYNAAVNDYHNAIETFPSSLMASWAGMGQKEYFAIGEAEKTVPGVSIK